MNAELKAIRDAWDPGDPVAKNIDSKRDTVKTLKLADKYVAAHPEEFVGLLEKSLEDCVKTLEVFRDAGLTEDEWRVQTWLFHRFEPQSIGGVYQPQLRVPGLG